MYNNNNKKLKMHSVQMTTDNACCSVVQLFNDNFSSTRVSVRPCVCMSECHIRDCNNKKVNVRETLFAMKSEVNLKKKKKCEKTKQKPDAHTLTHTLANSFGQVPN